MAEQRRDPAPVARPRWPAAAGGPPDHRRHEPVAAARHRAGRRRRGRSPTLRPLGARAVTCPRSRRCGVEHVPLPSLTRSWDPRRDVAGDPRAGRGAATARPRRAAHAQPQDRRDRPGRGSAARHPGRGQHLPRDLGLPHRPAPASCARLHRRGGGVVVQPRRAVPERHRPRHAHAVAAPLRGPRSSATARTSPGSRPPPTPGAGPGRAGRRATTPCWSAGSAGWSPRRASASSWRWPGRSAPPTVTGSRWSGSVRTTRTSPTPGPRRERRGPVARRAHRHARGLQRARRVRAALVPRGLQPLGDGGRCLPHRDGALRHPRLPRGGRPRASTCCSHRPATRSARRAGRSAGGRPGAA